MKDYNVKDGKLRWRGAYSGLLFIVTLAVVLIIAMPASAKSGISFTFFFSDGYYEESRMRHKQGTHVYRGQDRGWVRFYDVPRRHDIVRRHIHKPWRKHRHDFDHRHNHKHSRLHRSDHRKHTYFNRW